MRTLCPFGGELDGFDVFEGSGRFLGDAAASGATDQNSLSGRCACRDDQRVARHQLDGGAPLEESLDLSEGE